MIIAIETASNDGSLALADSDGTLLALDAWSADQRQGSVLLPRLMAMLAGGGHRLADLRAVAVGTGPGSFTGLRAAMSVAKGLAFGLSVPLVGIPSLEAWLSAEPEAVAALARAGARDAYLLESDGGPPQVRTFAELALTDLGAILAAPHDLSEALGLRSARPPLRAAAAVAAAAAVRLVADPSGDDLEHLEPAYLRPPRGLQPVLPWP